MMRIHTYHYADGNNPKITYITAGNGAGYIGEVHEGSSKLWYVTLYRGDGHILFNPFNYSQYINVQYPLMEPSITALSSGGVAVDSTL